MFFRATRSHLHAKRQRLEDEIVGYLIARKQPPRKLAAEASRLKMALQARAFQAEARL